MPKVSDRQKLLDNVEECMKLAAFVEVMQDSDYNSELDDSWGDPFPSDDEQESTFETLGNLHFMICQQRFFNPRQRLDKSRDYVLNYFLNQSDEAFRQITRVSKPTFHHIVSLIEYDPVFHNVSTCAQAPVHWQLACALDHLGNDGQGVLHARSKLIWGIGQGTVHLYTQRVVKALWGLRDMFITWPTAEERLQISSRMEGKGFKHYVGFVDGTTFPLHKKPAVHGNLFMDRKKRYSVNAQVVCDDKRRIQFFMTSSPGSSGDNRVFSQSFIARNPHVAFSGREYILSNSAYAATERVVPAYKENQRDDRADRNERRKIERFNTYLAKARVVNEHVIGILKARWASLRGIRVDIHEQEDMSTLVRQATACVILHNLCLHNDPWDDELAVDIEEDLEGAGQELLHVRILTRGQRRRFQVRRACLAFHNRE